MVPPPLNLQSNHSQYTLHSIEGDDTRALLSPSTPTYGSADSVPRSPTRPSSKNLIFNATLKMGCIFVVSTAVLLGTLLVALPTLEEQDRPMLRLPKSFEQLQDLNTLLKKYRDIYPYRIFICYVSTYLFLQAFSLPGSMYLSILGGAVWGVARAVPLACCCVATGATLCYLISAALGPALLTLPKWKAKLDTWAVKIGDNKDNLLSFLIVLRIAPLPPHWVVNLVCPHVGIGIIPFWISTALGILGVTVIHTTIGGGLDEMTSADDFHLISWKNFFGLSAIVVGVLIPVGLRYWFRGQADAETRVQLPPDEEVLEFAYDDETGDTVLQSTPLTPKTKAPEEDQRYRDNVEEYSSEEDDDADVVLEAGPATDASVKRYRD